VRIFEDGDTVSPITMATSGVTTINSLLQAADGSTVNGPNGPSVIDIGSGNTLRVATGGILLPDGDSFILSYSALTFSPTGTLTAGATDDTAATMFLQSQDADLNPATAQMLTVGAVIADNGTGVVDVRTSGPGFTVFTGANTYTGETLVGSGTLAIGDGVTASGTLGTGKTKVEASSVLAFNRPDALAVTGEVYGTGTVAQNGSGTTTLNGAAATTNRLNYVAVNGTLAAGVDNAINTTGTLTFGATTGAVTAATLDLTNGSATTGALLVQTNNGTPNSVIIGAGKTLATNGNVTIGTDSTAIGSAALTSLTLSGGGTWLVNQPSGTFQVGGATTSNNGNRGTVDMSGLAAFTADLGSAGIFRVGDVVGSSTGGGNNSSTVTLADTSTITAGIIGIGDRNGSAAGLGTLKLGAVSNTLNADRINVGQNNIDARGTGLHPLKPGRTDAPIKNLEKANSYQ